eukprot:359004-Chlamydomonas_euryale.AAC.3
MQPMNKSSVSETCSSKALPLLPVPRSLPPFSLCPAHCPPSPCALLTAPLLAAIFTSDPDVIAATMHVMPVVSTAIVGDGKSPRGGVYAGPRWGMQSG